MKTYKHKQQNSKCSQTCWQVGDDLPRRCSEIKCVFWVIVFESVFVYNLCKCVWPQIFLPTCKVCSVWEKTLDSFHVQLYANSLKMCCHTARKWAAFAFYCHATVILPGTAKASEWSLRFSYKRAVYPADNHTFLSSKTTNAALLIKSLINIVIWRRGSLLWKRCMQCKLE